MVNAAGGVMPPIPTTSRPIGEFPSGAIQDPTRSDVANDDLVEKLGTEESQRHETKSLKATKGETGSTSYKNGFHQVIDIPTSVALI